MRDENASQAMLPPSGTLTGGVQSSGATTYVDRPPGSAASVSERVGRLIRRAMQLLETDRRAAWTSLRDATTLLGAESEGPGGGTPTLPVTLHPGGLARWQAMRALAHIESNLETKIEIRALAELLALSKSHFSRAFKRSLGQPPMAYVAMRRVERAKILMTSTAQLLTEIALACGFADQSHLIRSFRRQVGMSPGCWRRAQMQALASVARPGCERQARSTAA